MQSERSEMYDEMMRLSKKSGARGFFTGTLIGLGIGLAVGFLYAPQPGERTRHQIGEKAQMVKGQVDRVMHRGREMAEEAVSQARSARSEA